MKHLICFLVTYPIAVGISVAAPAPIERELKILDRGLHDRVWQLPGPVQDRNGRARRPETFTEVSTGMHYVDEFGRLAEAEELFELIDGKAVARRGQIQVSLAANLNTAGAIDIAMPGGVRLTGHCLGLSYYDRALNKNVLIAEVRDTIGEQIAPNCIIYRSAFTDVKADVAVIVTRAGLSHTVVLRENLPVPEAWGLNSASTSLESYSEWIAPPAPTKTQQLLATDSAGRLLQLEDEALDFGSARIGNGVAFLIDGAIPDRVPVYKKWARMDGRDVLVESVDFLTVRRHLEMLGPAQAALQKRAENVRLAGVPRKGRVFPAQRLAKVPDRRRPIQVAKAPPTAGKGLAIDFELSNTTLTNYVFRSDTTYYISGQVNLSGKSNVMEGGVVIKYAPTNSSQIKFAGTNSALICKGDMYRPIVLTSRDDGTAGSTLTTSNNSGYYASSALYFDSQASSGVRLQNIRISYADTAITFDHPTNVVVKHAQIVKCSSAFSVYAGDFSVRNLLVFKTVRIVNGSAAPKVRCEHLTSREIDYLNSAGIATIYLTNSALIAVTNAGSYSGTGNAVESDPATVFQTVGGAAHYLANGSVYRNAGTLTIDSTLAAELKVRTTYPPIVVTSPIGWFTTNLTMIPQAQRDTDTPDIGYHYDPLDYAVASLAVSNATITLLPGTAVGVFCTNQSGAIYGFGLAHGAGLHSEGSPTNLNRIVRYNTVQEEANTNWSSIRAYSILTPWFTLSPAPTAGFRFTEFSCLAKDIEHLDGQSSTLEQQYPFTDCQFQGGFIYVTTKPSLTFTNCLLSRVDFWIDDAANYMTNIIRNCLFYGGSLLLSSSHDPWPVKDTLFDNLDFLEADGSFDADYNAYTTNSVRVGTGAHDVILLSSNVTYETGALGRYYLPTNSPMVNAGSQTNAALAGMYHYTTLTNQTKELTNRLDISFHYVATTNGVPIDTDSDGVPDYQEDTNGNGTVDSGETDWTSAGDLGLRVRITRPRNNSSLP